MLDPDVIRPAAPPRGRFWFAAATVAWLMLVSCKASVEAEANTSTSLAGDGVEAEESMDDAGESRSFGPESTPPENGETSTLLGARHDLVLISGDVECSCLSVALGLPSNPAFQWEAAVPAIAGASQQVIAFTSQGKVCPDEPKDSLGASYWGYEIRGKDVVVLIEPARQGRPITTGAIIPKPTGGGRTFVAPVDPSVPYGKAKAGDPKCAVDGG